MTTYDFISHNKRKTILLIVLFSALVLTLGWFLDRWYNAGGSFVVIAVLYATASALVGYFAGDSIALSTSGAQPTSKTDNPYVVRMVENLCITTGMPMPKVYVIPDMAINAFATGRDPAHASIAITTGAIQKLTNEELEGVIAHELSHIKNYDIRVMTLVIVLVGVVSLFADLLYRLSWIRGRRRDENSSGNGMMLLVGLVFIILSPLVAKIIQLAISRRREYLADASAALATRFPDGLARALQKIADESTPLTRASAATAHLYISNPFSGKTLASIFSTHPPIEKRIAALHDMAAKHTH